MERTDTEIDIKLQVLIATFGPEGMRRVADMCLPRVRGVEYLVSWQLPDGDCPVPGELAARPDLRVFKSDTRGVTRNRNLSLSRATAPWVLIADDDLVYMPGALERLIAEIEKRPQTDILCCEYICNGKFMKPYPDVPTPAGRAPKGWYANSFEIAFRLGSEAGKVRFNENFGVGAPLLQAGEEDIFLYEAARRGARCEILPLVLCRHDHDSTTERAAARPWFVMTQGAVLSHLHPLSWPLRLLRHSLRQRHFPALRYVWLGIRGARHARRHHYFG